MRKLKQIGLGLLTVVLAFFAYVVTRDGKFYYERSGLIQAPAEKIFPYLTSFQLGSNWSPYEKDDPNMKKTFSGNDGQIGSVMEFEGSDQMMTGKLELLGVVPNQSADIRLTMLKPFFAESLVQYKLTPEGDGTRFSWSLSGDGGFLGKLMSVLVDCDKMNGDQFNKGIANLKAVVEAQK